jgi:hypothetical protein
MRCLRRLVDPYLNCDSGVWCAAMTNAELAVIQSALNKINPCCTLIIDRTERMRHFGRHQAREEDHQPTPSNHNKSACIARRIRHTNIVS